MNNVFTFFADHAEQVSCWQHLRAHLRPGTLLLHSPSLELVTAHLCPSALGFAFDNWLQALHIGTAAMSTAVSVGTDTFSVYQIVANK
ncbi:hypothetical protein niasHT_035809 [Heterodera trifolii]|uniref:Uncharacterized protein n=1 Tax=Heterodera trifolii TaxID=157864 RepID=A0ABD2J008_9BILA